MISVVVYIIALFSAFFMACAIGAQDVSHAFATSVGSKALTIRQVMVIGSLCEFFGSLFGGDVAGLISSGVLMPEYYTDAYIRQYALIMLCTIAGAVTWLIIATRNSWPVSSTHSLVGALSGLGLYLYSINAINWKNINYLLLSWLFSPLLSGAISYCLFYPIHKYILGSDDPILAMNTYKPIFVGGTWFIMSSFILVSGPNIIRFPPSVAFTFGLLFGLSIGLYLYYSSSNARNFRQLPTDSSPSSILEDQEKTDISNNIKYPPINEAEEGFKSLMIITACIVSFAHGSNDVSNSIGPFSAIAEIFFNGKVEQGVVPFWILVFGGFGIVIGLITYGHKVMKTIGDDLLVFTYSRGFSSQLATAVSVLTATGIGMSVATTHCLIGSITGVAFVEGTNKLNLQTVKTIVSGWIITIPASAIFAILSYYILRIIF